MLEFVYITVPAAPPEALSTAAVALSRQAYQACDAMSALLAWQQREPGLVVREAPDAIAEAVAAAAEAGGAFAGSLGSSAQSSHPDGAPPEQQGQQHMHHQQQPALSNALHAQRERQRAWEDLRRVSALLRAAWVAVWPFRGLCGALRHMVVFDSRFRVSRTARRD